MKYILGLSAYYHDSAAVLLADGDIVAAAQEERFSRKRHDAAFPSRAVEFCLQHAGITLDDVENVVFYDKPFLTFERLLETHLAMAPFGLKAFMRAMPVWLKEKLYLKKLIRDALSGLSVSGDGELPELLFTTHHQSHAASAFFASPFQQAAVLCLDGVGEWATTSAWIGEGAKLSPLWQINFPHSIGLLYSAFTYYCGFKVNSGEYKLMGLAPYGEPRYADLIRQNLIDIKPDGSFRLDMSYFNFAAGLTMTGKRFHDLFGAEPRRPESEISQRDMDIARSIQVVTEEIVLRLASTLRQQTGCTKLCLAGGVALNCVANGRLLDEKVFDQIWVQPAAGDAGGALGAAYLSWHHYHDEPRHTDDGDKMHGALLGTEYSDDDIKNFLDTVGAEYTVYSQDDLSQHVADSLSENRVVGWFQGKMEYGPRALGSRSILGDPRSEDMQSTLNLKIKKRESFRPFAPAILKQNANEWFELAGDSPYMLFVTSLDRAKCFEVEHLDAGGLQQLHQKRSSVPAITHVDYSARVQTVDSRSNVAFRRLLQAFEAKTACPILINTSFNVRGEPIVESPADALRCFMRTGMDSLAIGCFVLRKEDQADELLANIEKSIAEALPVAAEDTSEKVDARALRQFALSTGVVVALLFGLLFPWLLASSINTDVLIVAGGWSAWGLLLPTSLRPVYNLWMRFGEVMHRIMTPLILSLIYFVLVTPFGLVRQVVGQDPLKRKLDDTVDSYAEESQSLSVENMKDPF